MLMQQVRDIHETADDIAKDLAGYATRAAVAQLTTNWTDAINDSNPQFSARSASADIDLVIANLTKLKLGLRDEPLAKRRMLVALGLEVDVPRWDSLPVDDRDSWVASYRERHDYVASGDDVSEAAKADYLDHKGIEPPHPLAYTR
jgi:hypothetical protein